jgi:hypothetical protein
MLPPVNLSADLAICSKRKVMFSSSRRGHFYVNYTFLKGRNDCHIKGVGERVLKDAKEGRATEGI